MSSQYTECDLTIIKDGPIQIIKFNNPSNKNAISHKAYEVIVKALREATDDDDITTTVLTGEGNYYSSGFNIAHAANDTDFSEDSIHRNVLNLRAFIDAFIRYPKLLIAVVNGPAIGIAVTTLALCDIIYASEKASFKTPFSKLGLCAEGCSSYTFPRILGTSRASDVLLLGTELSVEEAYRRGFVSEVYKTSDSERIWNKIKESAALPPASLQTSKRLIRKFNKDDLHNANFCETEELVKRFQSEEFMNSVMAFLSKKRSSKL